MDPKVLFWTGALVNMAVLVGFGAQGVRQIRRGEVEKHRRSMKTAASLIVAFLVAYALKLALLGREDFARWSDFHVNVLRFHETCVLFFILAGGFALWRARRMAKTRRVTRDPADPPASPSLLSSHRRAGWVALLASVLGLLSAGLVLLGMYQRVAL